MRRIALLSAILFLSLNTSAQTTQNFVQGSITTGGSSCSPATNCVVLNAIKNTGGVSITISASYSGTMQFEASADGSNYFSLSVTPLNGGSAVTSTTSTQGIWTTNASGLNNIRVRAQAGYSGGAVVMIQGSSASASVRGSSGGGGGSPTGPAGGDLGGTYPNPSVVQVNGAAIPASACDVSTNSSNQFTANTCTGSGNTVLATSPTLTTPNLGTPSTLVLTNATGLPLTGLANQAADTLLANATGSSAAPTAVAFPTSGTNGCAGATNALIYNTTTHALGCNTISSSSVALSSITAAAGANTIANGNNSAQIWNWALTSNGVTAFTFGETTAASGTGTNYILQAKTIAGSTASPLNVTNSLNGSQTLSTLVVTPTWNTTGVVDAGIYENVTNTASGTGSLLLDLQVGGTSQFKVDKAGNTTIGGTLITGGSTNGILFTCGTPSTPVSGQVGITPPSTCSNYGNYNLPALPGSAGLFHVAATSSNVSAVTVSAVTPSDATGNTSGSGNFCLVTSCVMTTPNLGTPSAATLTNATGLPISTGVSGLGTGVATALAAGVSGTGAICLASGSACSGGSASISFPQTVSGTTSSGGIPYFSNTTTLSSSAALAANHVLLGGGAGSAPTSDSNLDDGATASNTLTYAGSGGANFSGGPVKIGGSTAGAAFSCTTAQSPVSGYIGFTPPSSCSNYGNYNFPALPASAGLFHVAATSSNVSAVTVSQVSLTADVTGVLPIANGGVNASSAAAGTIPNATSSSAASWTATPTLGVDNSTAGTLQLANGSSNAHSILGSVATTSNTVNLFATAPTTGDLIDCVTSSTTCTLTDSGILASSVLHGTVTIAQGGTNATSAPSAGAIPNTSSSSASSWTVTPTLGLSGTAGTLSMFPASGNFTTTWGSAATASNTILGFATAPTTGDLVDCVTSSTTCTLTDSGVLAANVTTNSSNYPSNSVTYATGNHTQAGSANLTWSSPTLTIGASGTAGSLAEYNNTATTTWSSGATTSNTIKGFATAPVTGDLIACATSGTTCTLTDTGLLYPSASGSGTVTQTIANGTATLGTSAISSGACATVVTVAGTGIATTDNIQATFNADPTSTTGYSPSSSGMLTIISYPTSGNVNFKVCNNTASSVTPGAATLNWRVVR